MTTSKLPRISQLDFFRGLMLVVMTLDHLQYLPFVSLLPYAYPYTFQSLGFVSAAEGFFFLSGMLFAVVYVPKFFAQGLGVFDRLALRRAGYVYVWHIGTYICVTGLFLLPWYVANWPPDMWESRDMIKDMPFAMLLRAMVFMHQTGLLDILSMYVIFILITPLAVRMFAAGRGNVFMLFCGILWLAGQWRPQLFLESISDFHLGWFELASWQLMFYIGFYLGWKRATHADFRVPIKSQWIIAALLICVPLFIFRHFYETPDYLEMWLSDRSLGALRIINAAALIYLIYALCRWQPTWFCRGALVHLGRNAIYVFAYHVVLCYSLVPFRSFIQELSVPWQLALWLALTATIYLPVYLRQAMQRPRAV